jgi:pyruvate dehydrogenase E1 component alpha subunit
LIECVHYRAAPHATADDPRSYIDLARVEEERANEGLGRFERLLLDAGVLTEDRVEAARKEAEALMREGIAAAEAEPPPDPDLVFTHAYVDPPGNIRRG